MVTKKPKGLKLGLDALLGPALQGPVLGDAGPENEGAPPSTLNLDDLVPGLYQPRTRMDEGALYELAESIKAQGIMQPILVRRLSDDESRLRRKKDAQGRAQDLDQPVYEIIAGERRFRAARLAGLDSVPVLVRDVSDQAAAAMALIENMQREDLNPLEEAQGLQRLIREFGLTHEQAAQAVGRSRSAASNLLRLLNLADPVQTMLMAGDIDMGHARALLALDKANQITQASEIVARRLSVREAEKLVARHAGNGRQRPLLRVRQPKSRDVARLEEELSDLLTAKVEVRVKKRTKRGGQGELAIGFGSLDELDALIAKLRAPR